MLYEIHEKIIKLQKAGKKVINFNVGDPDQNTDDRIVDASIKSINEGETHYGAAGGEAELRKRLAEMHNVNPDNVLISPGSKWSIFSTLYLFAKGGNIILPSPHWTAFELMSKELGIEIRFLKRSLEQDWDIDVDRLQELIDGNTKSIVITSPDNPTSKSISDETMKTIVEMANEKKIMIMHDATYADIAFVNRKNILGFDGNHIFTGSFSKTFAMTGWRIGYIILDKQMAGRMEKLNQITITSIPTFVQMAALKALELKDEIANEIRETYRRRAELASKILRKSTLKFSKPDAPFYIFPKCDIDSEKLALDLLENSGVAITPGSAFGDYREYFRLALTMPDAEMGKGLEVIVEKFK